MNGCVIKADWWYRSLYLTFRSYCNLGSMTLCGSIGNNTDTQVHNRAVWLASNIVSYYCSKCHVTPSCMYAVCIDVFMYYVLLYYVCTTVDIPGGVHH
jgi:hypothetical protein